MATHRIEFDIRHCEGNFNCVSAAPEHFMAMPGGNKSDLVDGRMEGGLKILDVEEADLDKALAAARACPPQVIRVRELASGRVVAGPAAFVGEAAGNGSR